MNYKINIAYYNKEDWDQFLEIVDDRENIENTWEEWHKEFEKAKNNLISKNFEVNVVKVNLNELNAYCKIRGIKNDAKARSEFAANFNN